MLQYIINQLKDPTTWRGLCLILTAVGVALSPEQQAAIVTFGLAIAGLIGVFIPRGKNPLNS